MKIIRGLHNWKSNGPCVAAIGNFDGVHLGHQQLLSQLHKEATKYRLPAVIITFEPPPTVYFQQQHAPPRLLTLSSKLRELKEYQVNTVLCLHFNQKLASLLAEDFVKEVLVEALSIKSIIIGDDFHFGYQRRGNVALLQRLGQQYHFIVHQLAPYSIGTERVSSTTIRQLLLQGDLKQAQRFIGKPYAIRGRVVKGDQRGRLLGFPTANIALAQVLTVLTGVYVVQVTGITSNPLFGVANIGQRPTVTGKQRLLEVHLLDFNDNIYGKKMNVQFLHKLRDEQRFASLELLQQQIAFDKQQAKHYFDERAVIEL